MRLLSEFLYLLFNGALTGVRSTLFGIFPPRDPKTILILRAGNLGDTLCAVPALTAVRKRFPNARRILLTNETRNGLPFPKKVLQGLIDFDRIIAYDAVRLSQPAYALELIREIRKENVDLLVYLGQSIAPFTRVLRDMIFFRMAACKSAVGFKVDTHRYFVLTQRYNRNFLQESDRLTALLKPLGISESRYFEIPKSEFPILGKLPMKRPVIAIHPSAKYPVKRWPLERFAEVGKALRDRCHASIVIIGGKDTQNDAAFLKRSLQPDVFDFTGETTFLETAEILRRCDLLLSNDSGPVHIAAAVNTPVVGIYSARDFPNSWYPWGDQHQILRKDVDCQVCYLETCPVMICINRISTGEVLLACEKALNKGKSFVN